MSDPMLTVGALPDDGLNMDDIDLGEDAFASLAELWGLGAIDIDETMNEALAGREMDAIADQASLTIDPGLFDLGDADLSADLPAWLSDLDPTFDPSGPDLDF